MNASAHTHKQVAVTCAYVPIEIISAAGFTPVRLIPEPRPTDAEPFIHPLTCGYIKSLLAAGLRKDLSEMAGIIFPNCCDSMRKLNDIWEGNANLPSLMLDVPKKTDVLSVDFFAAELRRFSCRLHEQMPSPAAVTLEKLESSILFWNRIRRQMNDLFSAFGKTGMNGPSYQQYLDMMKMEPDAMMAAANAMSANLSQQPGDHQKIPIMLSGNLLPDSKLIGHIHRAGGRIAVLDTCTGNRCFEGEVEEGTDDPFSALARRYLTKPPCPRMMTLANRVDQFMAKIRSTSAAGVIVSIMKYCDVAMYEQTSFSQAAKDAAIPFLALENSYDGALSEQEKTRIDAFIESMGKEK